MKETVRYAVGCDSTVERLQEHARADGVKLARALLLFYEPFWTDKHRAEWSNLTGSDKATTRALRDLARKVLGHGPADNQPGRSNFRPLDGAQARYRRS